jgi:hypothetical protein
MNWLTERTYSTAIYCDQDTQLVSGILQVLTAYASSSADGSSDSTNVASVSSICRSRRVGGREFIIRVV